MRKYRPPLSKEEEQEIIRLSKLTFDGWSEADVREEFIVPLLKLLGYRKELDYSITREESYKLNPLFLQLGRDRIKLDYICSIRKQKFWIVEAKPGGRVKGEDEIPPIKIEDIAQAQFYSMHPKVDAKYFVVTNGWYVNLYERNKMDEELKPTLSFRNTEIKTYFNSLDSYIGSTQILFNLKQNILKDIETTLIAEVHLDRLDEFIDAAKRSVLNIRQTVLENFRANAKLQSEIREQELLDYLQKEDMEFLVTSIFNGEYSMGDMKRIAAVMASRYSKEQSHAKQYLFMSKLLLEKGRPVRISYYYNVLNFLIELKRQGIVVDFQTKSLKEIINDWVELTLLHFWKRKDLRYTWMIEGKIGRIIKQLVLLDKDLRQTIQQKTKHELFFFPEEDIAWLGPVPAKSLVQLVDRLIQAALDNLFLEYIEEGKPKESLIKTAIEDLEKIALMLEESFGEYYKELRKDLGSNWRDLLFYEAVNITFDKLSSGVCDVLSPHKDIINELPEIVKKRIYLQAYMEGINFAQECRDKMDDSLKVEEVDKIQLLKEYFSIDQNPYELTNRIVK